MPVARNTAQIVLIFLVSTAMVLPMFGWSFLDFGQPTKAEWVTKTDDDGKVTKEAVSDYSNEIKECVQRVYDRVHLPIQPEYNLIIVICFILGFVYLCSEYSDVADFEDLASEVLPKTAVVQCFVMLLVVFSFLLTNDPEAKLQQSIQDPELVSAIVQDYHMVAQILSWLLPFFIFLAFDIVTFIFFVVIGGAFEWFVQYLEERTMQDPSATELTGQVVMIREDGTTEYSRLNWELKWVPWPVMFLNRERLSVTSFNAFLGQLAGEAKNFVIERMQSGFKGVIEQVLLGMDRTVLVGYVKAYNEQFLEWARVNRNKIKADLGDGYFSSAENLLNRASVNTIRIIQQELVVETADITKRQLGDFWSNVFDDISNLGQNGGGLGEITPILPEGAKLLIRRGDTTVVVVEQKPQIRTVMFSRSFINHFGGLGVVEQGRDERFRLAFPYTLFVIRLIKGRVNAVGFFYRNEPLSSINDPVFAPNLPNIGAGGWVCMGSSFKLNKDTDLASQVEQVISYFWNSEFNVDLSSWFQSMAKQSVELGTLKRWEKETERDPAFVLKVDWHKLSSLESISKSLLDDSRAIDLIAEIKKLVREKSALVGTRIGSEISGHIASLDFSNVSDKSRSKLC